MKRFYLILLVNFVNCQDFYCNYENVENINFAISQGLNATLDQVSVTCDEHNLFKFAISDEIKCDEYVIQSVVANTLFILPHEVIVNCEESNKSI
jgi:hypothetical protein